MKNSYTLIRSDRPLLCLTPLIDPKAVERWEEDEELILKSSALLTRRQNDELTFSLYNTIDYSVDRWIQDKHYVPRLLVSAVVFTISYFIFSLAVRDPIPMIDELLISGVLAFLTWRAMSRRDSRSTLAQHRRHRLKVQASERRSLIEEELFALEEYLDEMGKIDAYGLSRQICGVEQAQLKPLVHSFDEATIGEIATLLELFLRRNNKPLLQLAHQIRAAKGHQGRSLKLADRIYHQTMHRGLDIGLLALIIVLKR